MRDTAAVLSKLNLDDTSSKLLAIVANSRGAEEASSFDEIQYLGIHSRFQKPFNNAIQIALLKILWYW